MKWLLIISETIKTEILSEDYVRWFVLESDDKKKDRQEQLLNAGIAGASHETIQRYGDAIKQHFVAYSGEDNELQKTLVKGLKQISKEKINPDYEYQNIRQQAGFSAEVKDVARSNAEKIINGETSRKIRTDDLGRVNDPLYDTVSIDANGNIIEGSGAQMKFLGASAKDPSTAGSAARALDKLQSKKFQKYLDADAKIDVPSDQYDSLIDQANNKIEDLAKQLENQKKSGNTEQVQKLEEHIEKLKKIKKNLQKSTVSSDEAVFARMHPVLSTAVDITKLSHRAGVKSAEISAIFGGSISIVKNIVSVCKGEIEPENAVLNVAKDTATTAVTGYATGFTGSVIKGIMQNSKSEYVRELSKTNIAGTIVNVTISTTKTMSRYLNGEIDGVECLEDLGEQGAGTIASAMFAAIGQAVIPIPFVGGLIGGMVGYSLSSASYGILMESLKEEKMAKEEREKIEEICNEHIKMIRQYRSEIEEIINKYLMDSTDIFREAFSGIKNALAIGDVDWFIESTNTLTESFGGEVAFRNMEDFNNKMMKGIPFKL